MMSDFVMDITIDDEGGVEGRTTAITAIKWFPLRIYPTIPFHFALCLRLEIGAWTRAQLR